MTTLSLTDLLALPAGRELDALIGHLAGVWVNPLPIYARWPSEEQRRELLPHYSATLQDAWPLLAEMLAAGECICMFYDAQNGLVLLWGKGLEDKDEDVPTLAAAPLAICRAWATWKMGGKA